MTSQTNNLSKPKYCNDTTPESCTTNPCCSTVYLTTLNRWSILLIWPGRFWRGLGRDIHVCQERPAVYNINHQRSRTIAQILKIYRKYFPTKFENLPNFLIMNLNHGERGLDLLCHLAEIFYCWMKNVQNAMDGN